MDRGDDPTRIYQNVPAEAITITSALSPNPPLEGEFCDGRAGFFDRIGVRWQSRRGVAIVLTPAAR
jgi:hypothetical protein